MKPDNPAQRLTGRINIQLTLRTLVAGPNTILCTYYTSQRAGGAARTDTAAAAVVVVVVVVRRYLVCVYCIIYLYMYDIHTPAVKRIIHRRRQSVVPIARV